MFVHDLKEVYAALVGRRVLVLVNVDVDAICACKIVQTLFAYDGVAYSLAAVDGVASLKAAYDDHRSDVERVLLLNCGATVDLLELLLPDEHVLFFLVDSHRPLDVCNVYSVHQVRLFSDRHQDCVPDFDDIFKDDDDEHQSDKESDCDQDQHDTTPETRMEKLQRTTEDKIRKRQERKQWEQNRNKLMFDYTQFSYYSRSTAVNIFELAWKLSKDNNDLLWWAIVGATEQVLLDKVENSQYILETGTLQSHVTRLAYNQQEHQKTQTCVSISLEKDVRLALYRHWNVESSLRYTAYTASRLRLWTLNGEKKLHQLLADMGLPLAQARQAYGSMDLDLRKEFLPTLEKLAEKYSISDIMFISFNLKYGYRNKFSATDVVYSLLAILEQGLDSTSDYNQNFQTALDALSRCHDDILRKGIEMSKRILMVLGRQIQSCMEAHQIVNAGPFLYVLLPTSTIDKWILGEPHWLGIFARWALSSYRGRHLLPLVVAAPRASGSCLILGIPPLADDSTKNLFGKAFEQASLKSNSQASLDFFDTSIVSVISQDINKFFDALTTLLT